MTFAPRTLLLLLAVGLTGCPKDDTKEETGDTGDTSGESGIDSEDVEPGCITVSGGGGYAHLADAVALASEGDVIELCDGTYAESVTVDKGVTIRGASADGVVLQGQGVEPALRVNAGGVTISGLTITSEYAGIVLDNATGATIDGVTFASPAYWAVQSNGGEGVTVSGCVFDAPGAGGIDVTGGSLTATGNEMTDVTSYAFDLADGAVVTLTDNVVNGVIMLSEDVSDGIAVNVLGASLTTSGNTFSNAEGMGIYAEDADLALGNDVITDPGYLGVFVFDGTLSFDGTTVSGALLQGVYAATPAVTATDLEVTVKPTPGNEYSYEDWGQNDTGPWFGGALFVADDITVRGFSTSGYNNYGFLVAPYSSGADAVVDLDGVQVTDTGRWGIYLQNVEGTLTNSSVTALREPELAIPCTEDGSTYYVDRSVGIMALESNVQISGSTTMSNEGWGLVSYTSAVAMDNVTISANACSGIINFGGVLTVEASAITYSNYLGGLWDYQGTAVLSGNTFSNAESGRVYGPYDDGHGGTYTYEYSGGQGMDINASSSDLTIVGNTFVDGDQAIVLYQTSAVIEDNVFESYNGNIVYAYQPPSGSPVEMTNNEVYSPGGYTVFAYYGEVEVDGLYVDEPVSTSYEYRQYHNGNLDYSFTSSSAPYVYYAYGSSSGGSARVQLRNVEIGSAPWYVGYTQDAELDFEDVHVGYAGSYGFYGYWSAEQAIVTMTDVSIDDVANDGMYLVDYGSNDAYVTLDQLAFGTVASDALYLSGFNALTLTNSQLGDPGGYGLYAYLDVVTGETTTIDNVSVAGATSSGLYVYGGNVVLSGSSASAGSSSGLRLQNSTATVTGNAFTGNGTYGMECYQTTLVSCAENDLSGNVAGPHTGCDDGCAIDEGGGETGGDTGTDTGGADTGGADTGGADTGGADTGTGDTGTADTGATDSGDTAGPKSTF